MPGVSVSEQQVSNRTGQHLTQDKRAAEIECTHTVFPSALKMSTSDDPSSPGPGPATPLTPPHGGLDADGGPIVLAGQYLTRCIDPFLSVDVLVVTAQQQADGVANPAARYM